MKLTLVILGTIAAAAAHATTEEIEERYNYRVPAKLHFPWYRPAPKPDYQCCRLPAVFEENVEPITCVAGSYLRPGESCWVACKDGCSDKRAFPTFEYKCGYDGELEEPNLKCVPEPPPPPPPKPCPLPPNHCLGPNHEVMKIGYTYSIKKWGHCSQTVYKTMFAWCDPEIPNRFNYCCGIGCQRFRCPKPALKPPKTYILVPKMQPEYLFADDLY